MMFELDGKPAFYAGGGMPGDAAQPALALVHGAGMDHTVWTLCARWFARHGHNVFAFDLPGHGRSAGPPLPSVEAMADWLRRALDALGVGSVAFAGHSMGALVALHAVAIAPARARRLLLLGFSYPMKVGAPLLAAAAADDHAAIDMLMIWGHDAQALIGGNAVPGMGIVTPIQRIVERAASGVLYNDLHACHIYAEGERAAQAVQCPVTMILGERDRMTPLTAARAFQQHFPQAAIALLKACGHGMLEEQPEETWRALAAALADRPVARA